jgi:hypothetical protein
MNEKKMARHQRGKYRKTKAGKAELERMQVEFPYVCVYWDKGRKKVKTREFCDLRRAAGILNLSIEEIFDNLRWGEGNWETEKFMIQTVHVDVWLRETAKQREAKRS